MTVTPPDLPMTTKVYSESGTLLAEFPGFTNLAVLDCMNDIPSFTMSYPLSAKNASSLISDSAIQLAVCMDKRDGNGFTEVVRFIYEEDNYDPSMPDSATVQATGRGTIALLDQAIVYPAGGVGSTTTSVSFAGASPGAIMHTLIAAAQARGCFPTLSMSFTSGQDSSGAAWVHGFTNSFNAGTSLLSLLMSMAQGGLVDVNMTGTTLNMYNPGTTLATDRSSTVYLRRSREIQQAPQQRTRKSLGTVMLAIGDNGLNVERTAATLGTLGRYEKYLSQSGVTDHTTLSYWADQALAAIDDQQISMSPVYVCDVNRLTPVPWKDYFPGDYVSIDYNGTPVKYRTRQWAVQCTAGGPTQVNPTLNDVFYDRNVINEGKLQALTAGTVSGIGSPLPVSGPNPTIPGTPSFIPANILTAAYFSPATGTTLAQIELAWTTPTNTDGTTMIDGFQYIIQYRLATVPIYPLLWTQVQGKSWSTVNGNPWTNVIDTPQNQQWATIQVGIDNTTAMVSGLICGETYEFQIACTDVSGNTSAFSAISSFATASDSVAPGQPDAPTVAASMVAVQVQHDLGAFGGGTLPLDLDHLEVHYSYDPAFIPVPGIGSSTYLGKILANAGMINAGIIAMGNFNMASTSGVYIKVIAVDTTGNRSQASPSAGVTAVLIDDQHISSLNVSKLIAGTITANIILGASIGTAASGQRAVMDMNGFHSYDANGNLVFDVNPSSSTLQLAASGNGTGGNKITIDASGIYPQIRFYDGTNTNYGFLLASSFNNITAGIALSSGTYTDTSFPGNSYANRLAMDGFGARLEVIDSTNQATNGGHLSVSDSGAYFGVSVEGAAHTAQLIYSYDSASTDSYWSITGAKYNAGTLAPAAEDTLLSGNVPGISSSISILTLNYGPTMYSAMLPMAQYFCATTTSIPASSITASSTTGFTQQLSAAPPAAWTSIFWSVRVR